MPSGMLPAPPRSSNLAAYVVEIAADELAHVGFLRNALRIQVVDQAAIDRPNRFNAPRGRGNLLGL